MRHQRGWNPNEIDPPVDRALICIQYTGGIPALLHMSFNGVNYVWEPGGYVSSTVPTHWHLLTEFLEPRP